MQIKKTFNTTKEEIESKKYNISIGISLGNKFFSKENLREYLKWSLKYTKGKIIFLIADKIHAINYSVRSSDESKNRNIKRALKEGDKIKKKLEELILELSIKEQSKVKILRWEEYEQEDGFYKNFISIICDEFENNKRFREKILSLIKSMINDRKFSNEEYLELSKYLLEEFVFSYSGVKIDSEYFGMYIYPQESILHEFLQEIQQGKIFPELGKKLTREKVVLAIVK